MILRYVQIAQHYWAEMDGYAVGHNLDLEELPIGRFCHFVWWWLTRDRSQEDVDKLRAQIWMPPKGMVATKGPWSAAEESAAFDALHAQATQ